MSKVLQIKTFLFLLLLLLSCKSQHSIDHYESDRIQVSADLGVDSMIIQTIGPYKDSIEKEMAVVIGHSGMYMKKEKPESLLGNFLADLVLVKAQQYAGQHVDFSVLNYGGIRLGSLPYGPVTIGKIFELMPFDNKIVVMKLDGPTTLILLNAIASSGGWPVSGVRFIIHREKATVISIQGKPFDETAYYHVAMPDYIANGGDNMSMLKEMPRKDLNIMIRDAIIEFIQEQHAQGLSIGSKIDGRIIHSYE